MSYKLAFICPVIISLITPANSESLSGTASYISKKLLGFSQNQSLMEREFVSFKVESGHIFYAFNTFGEDQPEGRIVYKKRYVIPLKNINNIIEDPEKWKNNGSEYYIVFQCEASASRCIIVQDCGAGTGSCSDTKDENARLDISPLLSVDRIRVLKAIIEIKKQFPTETTVEMFD